MAAQSKNRTAKKRRTVGKALTAAQKKQFLQTFKRIKLQIQNLERIGILASFRHI